MERSSTVVIDATMMVPWHKRLLNLFIDICAICVIFLLMGLIAGIFAAFGYYGMLNWITNLDGLTDRIFTTFVMVMYLFIMEVSTQRTVGKFITGTMVVTEDGSKPEARNIIIRAFCRVLGIEAFSFLSAYPRGWHDSASDTYVVDAKKYKQALEVQNSFDEIGTEQI